MCGRYVSVTKIKKIEKRFNVVASQPELYKPSTNISHGDLAPVICDDQPEVLQFFHFGFTPSWAAKPVYMINARAEGDHNKADDRNYQGAMGIVNKPMFRSSIRSRRCLVVADCFIEGPKKEKLSKPHVVYLRDKIRPFCLAGIWDEWVDKATGEVMKSFAVITTVANEVTEAIGHHRSPVIIDPENEQAWLNTGLPLAEVTSLLRPYPAELMNAYPVDVAIKSPSAEGLRLLDPIGERLFAEQEYELSREYKLEGMGSTTARERKNREGT